MIDLSALNEATAADFAAHLDGVFEHAPAIAARTAARRPFPTVTALHEALMDMVERADEGERLAFFRSHPELAARHLPPDLTDASLREQTGLAMAGATGADALPALNRAYRERFGIPFIICVARHTPENVLRRLRARSAGEPAGELACALAEVRYITRLRLVARVAGPGVPATSGHLSTHVLDTTTGRPAAGLEVALHQEGRLVTTVTADGDGRTPPLLPPGPLRQGHHALIFATAAYFAARRQPCFHPEVPVPFIISESEGRVHVPLLLAPFGYSTYRGS